MTNPPGQAFRYPKYLRDEIARIEGEEGKPVATFNVKEATQVSTDAEKRLEGLVRALQRLLMDWDKLPDAVQKEYIERHIKLVTKM